MPSRRTVVLGLAAVPALASAVPASRADDGGDGLFLGRGRPERRIEWQRAYLVPTDNGNIRYHLQFEVQRFADDDDVFLRRGATVLRSSSRGGDATRWSVGFDVDRTTADALAPWLGIPVPERRPVGQGLVASFAVVSGTTIRVTLTNGGAAPVGVILGGRNRGLRDNQFAFRVSRDGMELPPIEGWDFGGLAYVELLAPGGSVSREEDAAKWAAFDVPGRYEVRCRYEASLVPGSDFPSWPDRAHETWDAGWDGAVVIVR